MAPEKVETAYLESKFIDQIFVTCADLTLYEQNNVLAVVRPLRADRRTTQNTFAYKMRTDQY